MTNGNNVTQNTKHTNLFNQTKFALYSVPPAHAPASVLKVYKLEIWPNLCPNLLAQNHVFVKVWQSLCFYVGTSTSTVYIL
jgi:hypothetical protein